MNRPTPVNRAMSLVQSILYPSDEITASAVMKSVLLANPEVWGSDLAGLYPVGHFLEYVGKPQNADDLTLCSDQK